MSLRSESGQSFLLALVTACGYLMWYLLASPWYSYRALRRLYYLRLCLTETLECPAGHRATPAHGKWECAACGTIFQGWIFRSCPGCLQRATTYTCEAEGCGLTIINPMYR
jgi:hypothetical protein